MDSLFVESATLGDIPHASGEFIVIDIGYCRLSRPVARNCLGINVLRMHLAARIWHRACS